MKYVFRLVLCLLVLGLTHNGFAQPPKYAAGTTVIHQVKGASFQYIDFSHPIEVDVQMKVEDSGTSRWEMGDPRIKVEEITPLRTTPGIQVRMRLHKDAWKNGEKQLLITGHHKDGGRELSFTHGKFGKFTVVPLKTVIIAVDGLGHQSIINVLNSEKGLNFKKIFGKAVNRAEPALSALPTITFTNWPGIFGGLAPKDHGILGNSFFEREKAKDGVEPFFSDGVSAYVSNFSVARGELNNRVRIEASLYDEVAMEVGREMKVWSIHGFYPLTKRPHVDMRVKYFTGPLYDLTGLIHIIPEPIGTPYIGYNPQVAKNLDTASGDEGVEIVKNHIEELDILTIYFPGPDNVAHGIGGKKNLEGPFDVNVPLTAIEEQIQKVTDNELGKIVKEIEDRGYLNATLFVLVSDHGLHAYKNDRLHNIYLPEQRNSKPFSPREIQRKERAGLEDFFTAMGLKVWRGSNIGKKTLVYSPNGGMAHIYIRNTQEKNGELVAPWNKPARKVDIEMVARQLFVEAVGGAVGGEKYRPCKKPKGGRRETLTKDMQSTGCYATLTKLNGALGNPPAIFVRVGKDESVNHFTQDFRWLKRVKNTTLYELEYGEIDEFIQARHSKNSNFDWPEFAERIEEMNDKRANGSRTGDIVIFMDGRAGYLTVNESDNLNGWHGGATVSESNVPLMFNFPGSAVDEKFKKDLIKPIIDEVKNKSKRKSRTLRNWDLREILGNIYGSLHAFEYSTEENTPLAPPTPPTIHLGN